jgi:hypothetical protein
MDETRATANLPNLDIEIVHRRAPDGGSEQVSVTLRAVPGFESFGRYLDHAWFGNPAANWLAFTPFGLWARTLQSMAGAFRPFGLTGGLIGDRTVPGAAAGTRQRDTGSDGRVVRLPSPADRR